MANASFQITDSQVMECTGGWTISSMYQIEPQLQHISRLAAEIKTINISEISALDSAGALFLLNALDRIKEKNPDAKITGFNAKQQQLYDTVREEYSKIEAQEISTARQGLFYGVGFWAVDKFQQTYDFLEFIGEVVITLISTIIGEKKIQWRSVLKAIDVTGYQALPIISLMSFLIGVVLAYQLAGQLQTYGADIFIVDVTGIAILREFAPLITSVIIAGRTSTSFAALIGTMKVNEELDAMRTMGLSPINRLVIPRIIGLMIALPLLVVWADIFGVLGSMVMSKNMLDINFHAFLERFELVIEVKQYVLGLVKTPVFAMIIAAVGCFQGMEVEMSAESVGLKTTKAAVQAIFLIIIADAAFSIIFNELGY